MSKLSHLSLSLSLRVHIINDGQHSLRATTNKATPLPTTLPAVFPSRLNIFPRVYNKETNRFIVFLWSKYSAQVQAFHCKCRNKGCSSVQRKVFHCKLRTKFAVLLGINKCGSFPLISTRHSLFSIWTDLESSEKIPGAPSWRWGEWIWLTGPSGLHRNSQQELNISSSGFFGQIRHSEIIHPSPPLS